MERGSGGMHHSWRSKVGRIGWLLSTAPMLFASPVWANEQADSSSASASSDGSIIVYGQRMQDVLANIIPEDQLNEADIAAYGADTVGDLLQILNEEIDRSAAGPVVLINGRQTTGVSEIADLPAEAVSGIQLLPREVAGRLGQSPSRRVINITIKPNHRQATVKGEAGMATAGGGERVEGEVNLFSSRKVDRSSLVLRARRTERLLESERDILADAAALPFDALGNVISASTFGGEIDPELSALAGAPVAVAGLPVGNSNPTLAQFGANLANFTDPARFRTLISGQNAYSINGNVTRGLNSTTVAFNARAEWTQAEGLGGLFGARLFVPATSPFTPFSRNVGLARYIGPALEQDNTGFSFNAAGSLSTRLGGWQLNAFANFNHQISRNQSDVSYDLAAYQAAVQAGIINPFAPMAAENLELRRTSGRFAGDRAEAQAIFTGTLAKLPAGAVLATIKASFSSDRANSRSDLLTATRRTRYRREDAGVQADVQLPLWSSDSLTISGVMLDLHGAVRRQSHIGTLTDYGAALSLQVGPRLSVRASLLSEEVSPAAQSLSDAVTVIENFRVFDFLTGQTVQVRFLTGGNPDLPVATRRVLTLAGTWRPLPTRNLSLTADYTSRRISDVQAALPPTSAAVQTAFPDRFVRELGGRLILVDSRPVTFARESVEQFHWGFDFRGLLAGRAETEAADPANAGERSFSAGRSVRANLGLDHYWTLRNERQARPGLEVVDLLAGGATGYGGGLPRHTVRATAGASTRGLGLQLVGAWRSRTRIRAGTAPAPGDLTFAPRALIDARLFADLGPVFPGIEVLKGARLSLEVKNLFDSKQRVRDMAGVTPLRYQPYLLDALGRTVSLSLRKVF